MPTTDIRVLATDCKVRECATLVGAQESDFSYNLDTATEPVSPVTCRVKNCESVTGEPPQSDLTIYNLSDRLQFNGTEITVIPVCPEGYYCPPGSVPPTITYPPGTFTVYVPPDDGTPMVLSGEGCESVITVALGMNPSAAAIAAAVSYITGQMAAQQGRCDVINPVGGGGPTRLPAAITLGDLPQQYTCVDAVYSGTIQSTSSVPAPYTMLIVPLPSWITPSQDPNTLFLNGTPTTIGDYSFTAYAATDGASGQRDYTISVVGIATASPLPNAPLHYDYSQTLTAPSIPGILSWAVTGGALPTWMFLNSTTGELYGTPLPADVGWIDNFTISVTNGTITCQKEFDIETTDPAGIFWDIAWVPYTVTDDVPPGLSVVSVSAAHNIVSVGGQVHRSANCLSYGSFYGGGTGTLVYTGPAINCQVTFTSYGRVAGLTAFTFHASGTGGVGLLLNKAGVGDFTDGVNVFPFTIPATVGAVITFRGTNPATPYFCADLAQNEVACGSFRISGCDIFIEQL